MSPVKPEDVTVARLEQYLDRLAEIMAHPRSRPEALLPIYERLEREIAARQTTAAKLDTIMARARRLKDRKAT